MPASVYGPAPSSLAQQTPTEDQDFSHKSYPNNLAIPYPEMCTAFFLGHPQRGMKRRLPASNRNLPDRTARFHEVHVNRIAATARAFQNRPLRRVTAHNEDGASELRWKLRSTAYLDNLRDLMASAEAEPKLFEVSNQFFHSCRHVVSRKGRTSPRPQV